MRSLYLFLMTLGLVIYTGCGSYNYKYIYKKPSLQAMNVKDSSAIPNTGRINFSDLELRLEIQTEIFHSVAILPVASTAYAFKPNFRYTPAEHVNDIKIVPLEDYNTTYPAHSDMSFECEYIDRFNHKMTKNEWIDLLNNPQTNGPSQISYTINIQLRSKPKQRTNQKFAIEITTDEGSLLTDTTQIIDLLP